MDKKILAFDGGGVLGVIPLTFIINLEKELGTTLRDYVDVFAGTSTGAIIATALSGGISAQEILEVYISVCSEIFRPSRCIDSFLGLKSKYSSENLFEILKGAFASRGVNPDTPLRALPKEVVILTVTLNDQSIQRCRMKILTKDNDLPIIDAIMASSAAPTLFDAYHDCVDGGIVANDPSIVAYAVHRGAKSLLSFGTGYTNNSLSIEKDRGALNWVIDFGSDNEPLKTPLLTMLLDAQGQLPGQLCKLLMGSRYERLNINLDESIKPDEADKIPFLIKKAQSFIANHPREWNATCKWVEKQFIL